MVYAIVSKTIRCNVCEGSTPSPGTYERQTYPPKKSNAKALSRICKTNDPASRFSERKLV